MKKVRIDEVENSVQPAAVMRHLTEPLGATDLAINYYELEPGDSFAFAYHDHEVQEELFYIMEGTATFDTADGPIEVAAGEIIRFGREEFQRGWNRGDERVRALALGAPLEYGRQHKLRYCPDCEEETENRLERVADETAVVGYCKNCDAETGRWTRGSMEGTVP
ncbi:cupin domain containing protein [Halalkaliarchaeum desulfuricum]|uniref:Cupin domain containing protein n=1 Tax=Halalkaliarchaeum desulfuricum TaxID=2055893 RepID=A0A343TKE6_9EURY|nr:cupin domain-containing protein [Halalkaliarchaeum desulfuricum]AUX09568.1 cupin domain containing protein [Halalkaliarchaeum desulfuricum]